jgi:hypothetical protein
MSDMPKMVEVTAADANNYCRVLSALGMEEEGDPVQEITSIKDELAATRAELDRERIRLAACGVVALANTPESAARAREMHDEYRSASCDDAARAVDEQMRLRAELARAMLVINSAQCVRHESPALSEAIFALEGRVKEWEAGR